VVDVHDHSVIGRRRQCSTASAAESKRAGRLYGSMGLLLQTVDRFFAAMTPGQAPSWADAA
jgi:hypothetical protein